MAELLPRRISQTAFQVFLALVFAYSGATQPTVTPAPEWDSKFQRTNGWIGADGAFSIPLATNRTLWLFGDTFVGEVKDGKRVNAKMINNSIAIQHDTNAPEFFYRTNRNEPFAFFAPRVGPTYFWPFHGIRTGRGLFVFLHQVKNVKTGTPFGFRMVDVWLARITNPDEPPSRWKIKQEPFRFSECSTNGLLTFSSSLLRHDGFIYAFGEDSRRNKPRQGLVVARVSERDFPDLKHWRFWDGVAWQEDFRKAAVVCPGIASELSVSWQPSLKKFVLVTSESIFGKIAVITAPAPEGPWENRRTIYEIPEVKTIEKTFAYAGKGHPEFSADDELLITYAVNSWNFWNLFNDPRLYWPKFIRVKF